MDKDLEKGGKWDFESEKRLTVRETEMGQALDVGLGVAVAVAGMGEERGVTSYYDDSLSDVEEEDDVDADFDSAARATVGVAKTADVQVVTLVRTGEPRVVEYKKL